MKIVSWNANCKFREKYKEVAKLGADLYVIQECENPAHLDVAAYQAFVQNGFWTGDLKFKGLMVFSPNPDIKLKHLDWEVQTHRYFLLVRVNDTFTLIGSWACKPYIEEFTDFIHTAKRDLADDTIIIGDLNNM